MRASLILLTTCIVLGTSIPAAAEGYAFETFRVPYPPGTGSNTFATAINNAGVVAGYFRVNAGNTPKLRSFKRYPGGAFDYPIKHPSDDFINTIAKSINNDGTIAGDVSTSAGITRGFVLSDDVYSLVAVTPGGFTTVNGINDRGDIVGNETILAGNIVIRGYLLSDGSATVIEVPGMPREFVTPNGIARDRTVVGGFFHPETRSYLGFLRGPRGRYFGFRFARTNVILAYGVNNAAGKVVGAWLNNRTFYTGFVYDYAADRGAVDAVLTAPEATVQIRTVPVEVVHVPGSLETHVLGINARGVITGHCKFSDGSYGFVGTPVP
jgi:hypothetical protein